MAQKYSYTRQKNKPEEWKRSVFKAEDKKQLGNMLLTCLKLQWNAPVDCSKDDLK